MQDVSSLVEGINPYRGSVKPYDDDTKRKHARKKAIPCEPFDNGGEKRIMFVEYLYKNSSVCRMYVCLLVDKDDKILCKKFLPR